MIYRTGIRVFLLGLLVFASSCVHKKRPPKVIPASKVWAHVQLKAAGQGLDPHFVYAICTAESTLDANAETDVARGMMQLTEAAWSDVTQRPYRHAFNWKINTDTGILYLGRLKGMLMKEGVFSYPRLAASYRWGFTRLKRGGFDVDKLPAPKNRIYQRLFAGEIAPVASPEGG